MVSIGVQLEAYFADNVATASAITHIEVSVEPSAGYLAIKPVGGRLQSAYVLSVKEGSPVEFEQAPESSLEQIVSVAASLCCERIFLSPVSLRTNKLEVGGRMGFHGSLSLRLRSASSEHIDEKEFFDFCGIMIALRTAASLSALNLREALFSYHNATRSIDPITRFGHLWAAFEKAVNASQGPGGRMFDKRAAELIGVKSDEISGLRSLNNRLKHPLRGVSDIEAVRDMNSSVGNQSRLLKMVTDQALKLRMAEIQAA